MPGIDELISQSLSYYKVCLLVYLPTPLRGVSVIRLVPNQSPSLISRDFS